MKTNIEIARPCSPRDIREVAADLGLNEDQLSLYGNDKAKIRLDAAEGREPGKLILVTAISPTPAGEGKTTVSIGLSQGMNKVGHQTTVVLREPSLGPVFGMKGGATGGGHAQVIPMEDINLHFTGDFSAIEKAHNLLAALIDNALQNPQSEAGLDARSVLWKRVLDVNDRCLRDIVVGLGGRFSGVPRETGFDITAASEVMAILCLCSDLPDLKKRLGNILIGTKADGSGIYAKDIRANGAMAALLKDAIKPNLVQTLEGTPAIIHGGPFANIAQGTNSVIATRMGLALSDYVVTEAGFGADLGAEKFFNIKCAGADLSPQAVVMVATVRALKYHGGAALGALGEENIDALEKGFANLEKHLENVAKFSLPAVVAVNVFSQDTPAEIECLIKRCQAIGVDAIATRVWESGGDGAIELARAVAAKIEQSSAKFTPLYDWKLPVRDKIETIATSIYGAKAVDYSPSAKRDLDKIERLGLDRLPVCIAKTQKSLSDNPQLLGRPEDFVVTVREIEIAAGAGFLVPITGPILRMPGLPRTPAAENIDIDDDGNISGLF